VIISLISLANVVVRYFTDASFAFTEKISVFLLVILTFAGTTVAMRSNRHIRIGLLERLFPRLRTPTEAAVVGVAYGVVIGLFITRELDWRLCGEAVVISGVVMLIIALAGIFAWVGTLLGTWPNG
jgi:TRAP-type C4-dicarboxylate transport system permease small subunit